MRKERKCSSSTTPPAPARPRRISPWRKAAPSTNSQALAFAKNEQKGPEYLKINPRGRVPALVIDEGTIVENTAILDFIAAKYAPQLMPKDPVQRARAISLMAWFSNNVHPSFTHISRPERFATDTKVFDHLKEVGRSNFHNCLKEIDGIIGSKPWILGDQFSVVDCYALVFYGWGKRIGLPVEELKNYTRLEGPHAGAAGGAARAGARAERAGGRVDPAVIPSVASATHIIAVASHSQSR